VRAPAPVEAEGGREGEERKVFRPRITLCTTAPSNLGERLHGAARLAVLSLGIVLRSEDAVSVGEVAQSGGKHAPSPSSPQPAWGSPWPCFLA